MQDSIYTALFGALSNEHKLDLIANNLANVNTTGYKKDQIAFQDVFRPLPYDRIVNDKPYARAEKMWPEATLLSKVRLSGERPDLSQGSLKLTGDPLDFALQGEGFFVLQTPDGAQRLSRGGSFTLNQDGNLMDGNGNLVLGEGGPIVLPQGKVTADAGGSIRVDGQEVDRFQIVGVADPNNLEKVGGNLYRVAGAAGAAGAAQPIEAGVAAVAEGQDQPSVRTTVNQGYLESSNVEVVSEMVTMIEVQRTFEAYQKIMQSSQQMDDRRIQATRSL